MRERPVAVQYCATFLKPEMLHIYRQITALRQWRPVVICQKREEAGRFPFDPQALTIIPKPATHSLRRIWVKQIRRRPMMIYRSEVRRIAAEIERVHGEVLHIYFGNIAVHLLPLMRRAPVPVIVSFHGADAGVDMDQPAYREAAEEMFQLARLVLARSKALAERLVALGCPQEKIRIHRTGIPLERFPFVPRSAPEDGEWRLFQACRLIPKKGLATALEAFARFVEKHPRATFQIAGEGPLLDELSAKAASLGLADRVRFTGFLSHDALVEQLAAAHIFVHPSETGPDGNQEGVPNAMLEAMSTGIPVAATYHGGIPEAVDDGVSGFLVAERDAQGLAEALLKLVADPGRYAAMGAAAAQSVAERFEQARQAIVLEGFYTEAVCKIPPTAPSDQDGCAPIGESPAMNSAVFPRSQVELRNALASEVALRSPCHRKRCDCRTGRQESGVPCLSVPYCCGAVRSATSQAGAFPSSTWERGTWGDAPGWYGIAPLALKIRRLCSPRWERATLNLIGWRRHLCDKLQGHPQLP